MKAWHLSRIFFGGLVAVWLLIAVAPPPPEPIDWNDYVIARTTKI